MHYVKLSDKISTFTYVFRIIIKILNLVRSV